MAGHLAQAGHQVTVYNRTASKAKLWSERYSGRVADNLAQAVADAELVLLCVGGDPDLRSLCLGESGLLQHMRAGALLIDHTTASAQVARELQQAAGSHGVDFIDAPVSGGQAGAENGVLTIMVGGQRQHFDRAAGIFSCYARKFELLGAVGCGQLTKMVNQVCIAGLVQALAEALRFAQAAGLDGEQVIEVISKGAAQSWQMENRAQTMLAGQFDFGFAVDWMRKDLSIVLNQAQQLGLSLPVTALVDQFYAEVQNQGGGRWDTSSLIARLPQAR